MRLDSRTRFLVGGGLLLVGLGVATHGRVFRNVVTQTVVGAFDLSDRDCRTSPRAVGASCPAGCVARPATSSESRGAPTECRSPLWVALCGKACSPAKGFDRLSDGRLIDGRHLTVVLRGAPDDATRAQFAKLRLTLVPRFDGLDRYDAVLDAGSVQETKKRLSALPQVQSVEFVAR